MKNILILILAIIVSSCASDQNKDNKVNSDANQLAPGVTVVDPSDAGTTLVAPAPPQEEIAQVDIPADKDGKLYHYICADLCKGSGTDTHGNCPVCGKALAHNQGFHAGQENKTQINTSDLPNGLNGVTIGGQPGVTTTVAPPQQNEPPQNAKGVWHFTCAKGCAGGAGLDTNCSSCGSQLQHNPAYHN